MAFHFVMVLVGLLEASIAAKREQDYLLPTHRVEAFVDGVPFFLFFLSYLNLNFTPDYDYSRNLFLLIVLYLFNISINFLNDNNNNNNNMLMRLWNV